MTYSENDLLGALGPPAVSGELVGSAGFEQGSAPRYMGWDCLNRGIDKIKDGCYAVSGQPPTDWHMSRVCARHVGLIHPSGREVPATVAWHDFVVVDERAFQERRGAEWDVLQQKIADGFETVVVGMDPRVPEVHIVALRRPLSQSSAYNKYELFAFFGSPQSTETETKNNADDATAETMRWDCGCLATATGEEWFVAQICRRHNQTISDGSSDRPARQMLLVDEDSYREQSGPDWITLQEHISKGSKVLVVAIHRQVRGFRIYVLENTNVTQASGA